MFVTLFGIAMDLRDQQFSKAEYGILGSAFGRLMAESEEHPLKALESMLQVEFEKITEFNLLHHAKARFPTFVTEDGMVRLSKFSH